MQSQESWAQLSQEALQTGDWPQALYAISRLPRTHEHEKLFKASLDNLCLSYLGRCAPNQEQLEKLAIPPVEASHIEHSLVLSMHDEASSPSQRLFTLSFDAIYRASRFLIEDVQDRGGHAKFANVWPGEHYRLLSAFVDVLKPKKIVEIGTGSGLSALAMLRKLDSNSRVITYDMTSWRDHSDNILNIGDFSDGRLKQVVSTLESEETWKGCRKDLSNADFIFVDAPKDGVFEYRFLENLEQVHFESPPIVMFDDIRLWNMLAIWRGIKRPKLDLTSFGHWSGSGIVDWLH